MSTSGEFSEFPKPHLTCKIAPSRSNWTPQITNNFLGHFCRGQNPGWEDSGRPAEGHKLPPLPVPRRPGVAQLWGCFPRTFPKLLRVQGSLPAGQGTASYCCSRNSYHPTLQRGDGGSKRLPTQNIQPPPPCTDGRESKIGVWCHVADGRQVGEDTRRTLQRATYRSCMTIGPLTNTPPSEKSWRGSQDGPSNLMPVLLSASCVASGQSLHFSEHLYPSPS